MFLPSAAYPRQDVVGASLQLSSLVGGAEPNYYCLRFCSFDGSIDKLAYFDYLSSALPYHLLDQPGVLVLGAGGGADVLQALYHRASHIDAVELNPQVVDLVNREFAQFTGALYERHGVSIYQREARGFVSGSETSYDLIQVALMMLRAVSRRAPLTSPSRAS